jgi:murein L,D-transpeptidase YcbB/YkuD
MKHIVMAALAVFLSLMIVAPVAIAADNEKVAAELKAIIESGEPVIGNEDNDERIVEVYVFYGADRDFKPIWVRDTGPKAKAREVLAVFKTAADLGLSPANYRVAEIDKRLGAKTPRELAELELLISRAFIDYGRDVNRGRITPKKASSENAIVAKEVGALILIDGAEMADDIAEFVETLEPRSREYARLKLALGVYRGIAVNGGWPTVPKGPALKPAMRDGRVAALRKRLEASGDLEGSDMAEADVYDPVLVDAVKKFQTRHGLTPDGIIAQTTLDALNVPVVERVRQLELNLERRRWMDDNLGEQYVFVNVADQELKMVRGDRTVHTARIVVGKPYNRTPVFSETMKYIVLNPNWNVPASIANKEYLPKLKKNPGALRREGIRLFSGSGDTAGEVDPFSINWSAADRMAFALRQDSGAKNALGRVKFMFPNRFNVYIHDTPAKSLFEKDLRAFSHGCMRVENPFDLAALLLADQGWTRAKIDAVVASGKQRVVNLKTPVPVHVAYLTAWVDKDGTVNFRRDVYGRDKLLAQAMEGSLPEGG